MTNNNVTVRDLPENGISWETVATYMNSERYSHDYLMRWSIIKKNHINKSTNENSKIFEDIQLLESIQLYEPDDESEVVWADIDRKLKKLPGKSSILFLFIYLTFILL